MAAEKAKLNSMVSTMARKAVDHVSAAGKAEQGKKEVLWMRDPTTGNWIPETHFGDVDTADLRAKLLSNNHTN